MSDNPLKLRQIHHVEFWVGNAKQAAYFYRKAFGFSQVAYAGLETGQPRPDLVRAAAGQGAVRVRRPPLAPTAPVADHVRRHGDGVRDIAFQVDDADAAFDEAVTRGADAGRRAARRGGRPRRASAGPPSRPTATRSTRSSPDADYHGPFLPGFVERARRRTATPGILRIDHIVGNVELGKMDYWADWYSARARLQALHQLRRQGHLDRVQRAHEHRHVRRCARHQVPDQRAGARASARARSRSTWTTTAGPACSTSRC